MDSQVGREQGGLCQCRFRNLFCLLLCWFVCVCCCAGMLLQRTCRFAYVTGAIQLFWICYLWGLAFFFFLALFFFKAYLLFPAPQGELWIALQHAEQVVGLCVFIPLRIVSAAWFCSAWEFRVSSGCFWIFTVYQHETNVVQARSISLHCSFVPALVNFALM